jgi:23S rRNA (guanosine2251-2'-O)-methyltransferase
MGGGLHVPLIKDNLFQVMKLLKQEGVKIVGVIPTGSTDYYYERLTGSVALLLGGEDRRINASLLDRCDNTVRIPMRGRITSLNVGVAAAVVLYERMRQLASA